LCSGRSTGDGPRIAQARCSKTRIASSPISEAFSDAQTIVLVQDNLNIHNKASLYEAFPSAEARRLLERFEWHYTPKHGSWLDLAESELGVLSSQCLDRRVT
jgi:hypothetical protein